jgi:hypothetical protein
MIVSEAKMLAVQGYFEAGRFITDTSIQIPERKKTIVTVLDESIDEIRDTVDAHAAFLYKKKWNEIIDELENCDEVLEGVPERIHFRSPEEIDTL